MSTYAWRRCLSAFGDFSRYWGDLFWPLIIVSANLYKNPLLCHNCVDMYTQGKFYFVLFYLFLHISRRQELACESLCPYAKQSCYLQGISQTFLKYTKGWKLELHNRPLLLLVGHFFAKLITLIISTVSSLVVLPCDTQLCLLQKIQ